MNRSDFNKNLSKNCNTLLLNLPSCDQNSNLLIIHNYKPYFLLLFVLILILVMFLIDDLQ